MTHSIGNYARLGGIAHAKKTRAASHAKYLLSPNHCKHCNNPILPLPHQRIADVKVKIFCNLSCNAAYQNRLKPKRARTAKSSGICKKCNAPVAYKPRKDHGYFVRQFCDRCALINRLARLNVDYIAQRTKGDVFSNRKNWQSARNSIRTHAHKVFCESKKPFVCVICGYDKHVEVCHIRRVADFPATSTIEEINDIKNLVSLCPNHHWEFDNGMLILSFQGAT